MCFIEHHGQNGVSLKLYTIVTICDNGICSLRWLMVASASPMAIDVWTHLRQLTTLKWYILAVACNTD